MKKLLLIAAAAGTAFFTSCEKISTHEPTVVGTWEATGSSVVRTINGKTAYETSMFGEEVKRRRLIFESDGTGSVVGNFARDGKNDWHTFQTFKWMPSDDKNRIVISEKRHINPPGMIIDYLVFFAETDWTIHQLTTSSMAVSYTLIRYDPELVAVIPELNDVRENMHYAYRKIGK